jgi:hypothetical protein
MSTLVRFITAALTRIKVSTKLKAFIISILACGIICLILHYNAAYGIAAMFGSIFYGVSCAGVYPLLLSLPAEFGLKFTP